MKKETSNYIVIRTIAAAAVLLAFFFFQGMIVIVYHIEGTASALIRAAVIGTASLCAVVYSLLRYHSLTPIGFNRPERGSSGKLLFYIPLLLVAICPLLFGVDLEKGVEYIAANCFLALNIGLAEEIYFRGIICNLWLRKNVKKAVIISSVLFGACHLMNVMGGAGLAETLLQICFAFAYGIVFALIFISGKSIIPCILLHCFHDFCSFISASRSENENIILGAIQFVIITLYILLIIKNNKVFMSEE